MTGNEFNKQWQCLFVCKSSNVGTRGILHVNFSFTPYSSLSTSFSLFSRRNLSASDNASCLRSVSHCFSHPAACGRHVWSLSRRFSDVYSTLLNYISSCELHPINSSLPKVSLGVHEIACTANKTLVDLTITSREQQEPKYTQWRRRVKEKFA